MGSVGMQVWGEEGALGTGEGASWFHDICLSPFSVVDCTIPQTGRVIKKRGSLWLRVLVQGPETQSGDNCLFGRVPRWYRASHSVRQGAHKRPGEPDFQSTLTLR